MATRKKPAEKPDQTKVDVVSFIYISAHVDRARERLAVLRELFTADSPLDLDDDSRAGIALSICDAINSLGAIRDLLNKE